MNLIVFKTIKYLQLICVQTLNLDFAVISLLAHAYLNDWLIDWLINPLKCFFGIEGHVALDWNPGLWSKELFKVHAPIDNSTHYPAL